jgi:hypothetical protein
MLLRLSQLQNQSILIFLVILTSCSWRKEPDTSVDPLTKFKIHWFKTNLDHSLVDQKGVPVTHLLFDNTPEFNLPQREVNVVISTLKGSDHKYSIDLASGQRYYSHTFCEQKDIWNHYNSTLRVPPFSIGYIPRVLDQLGEPQKVIVWSDQKSFFESAFKNYHKVRLIGAYVEHTCLEGNCVGKNNWLAKLVFIAVDGDDLRINNLTDFKNNIDWDKSRAYLANMEGQNFMSHQAFPSTRIGDLIEYEDAFNYFKKRSIFLNQSELNKIQKGCHVLYDSLWREVGELRAEDKAANTKEELNLKMKLIESLKSQKIPVGFAARFRTFTKKYFKEITTCEKFVYHGNINRNQESFWFLSYIGLYYRLHREGYHFDCRKKNWQEKTLNNQGQLISDFVRDIDFCRDESDFDKAMQLLPHFLNSLKSHKEFFKFIDYDNHTFGTHQKIYSWIKFQTKHFDCKNDPNQEIIKNTQVFPSDINWKNRDTEDMADKMKIIY